MPKTGASGDAREASIGDQRYRFPPGDMLERRGQLIGLFHPGAGRPAADHHHDVALFDLAAFDRLDRPGFRDKHPRPPGVTVHPVLTHDRWVDRRGLDHRSFRRDVTHREGHRGGQPPCFGAFRRQDHVVRIDAILLAQALPEAFAAHRGLPPVEVFPDGLPGHRHGIFVQQTQRAQMEHYFRHAAREEGPHRRVIIRPVGQNAHQPRHLTVDARPVIDVRNSAARRMGNGRDMQQQVGRAAERGMDHHRVLNRFVGEDIACGDAAVIQLHHRPRGLAGNLQPHVLPGRGQCGMRQRQP